MRADFLATVQDRDHQRANHVDAVRQLAQVLEQRVSEQLRQETTIAPMAHQHNRTNVQAEHEFADRPEHRDVAGLDVPIVRVEYASDEEHGDERPVQCHPYGTRSESRVSRLVQQPATKCATQKRAYANDGMRIEHIQVGHHDVYSVWFRELMIC